MLPAAQSFPFTLAADTDVQAFGTAILLRGWSLKNVDGANPGSVRLIDGTTTDGTEIATVDLLASESTREWFSGDAIGVFSGLRVEAIAVGIQGTIWYSPGTLEDGYLFTDGAKGVWSGE